MPQGRMSLFHHAYAACHACVACSRAKANQSASSSYANPNAHLCLTCRSDPITACSLLLVVFALSFCHGMHSPLSCLSSFIRLRSPILHSCVSTHQQATSHKPQATHTHHQPATRHPSCSPHIKLTPSPPSRPHPKRSGHHAHHMPSTRSSME